MQHSKFVVDKKPFCVWESDLHGKNLECINNLDPSYFKYLADVHRQGLETDEHQQHAALSLRTAYAHGLETFFAILFAAIQAPDCVIGWLQKYQLEDLRKLIQKVHRGQPIHSKLSITSLTWQTIAHTILTFVTFEDTPEKENSIKDQFAAAWARFAHDFLDEMSSQEYNSIKHGFRIRTGGFSLAIGRADTWGVPAPLERMQALGGSKFGSSFFTLEGIPERLSDAQKASKYTPGLKHHFRIRHHSRNWAPETSFYGLPLLAISMQNTLSFLKVLHGLDSTTMKFIWPSDASLFDAPWSSGPAVTSYDFAGMITIKDITPFSEEETLAAYPPEQEPDMREHAS